jgi:hypothetical protein
MKHKDMFALVSKPLFGNGSPVYPPPNQASLLGRR